MVQTKIQSLHRFATCVDDSINYGGIYHGPRNRHMYNVCTNTPKKCIKIQTCELELFFLKRTFNTSYTGLKVLKTIEK